VRFKLVFFVSSVLLPLFAAEQNPKQVVVVNNDYVIQLTNSGVAEGVILTVVNLPGGQFDMSLGALQALAKAKVSPQVIAAMFGDLKPSPSTATTTATPASQAPSSVGEKIPPGTLLRLLLTTEIDSKKVQEGDPVEYTLMEALTVDGQVLIPEGTKAFGEVTQARAKARFGVPGVLHVNVQRITLPDGSSLHLIGHGSPKPGSIIHGIDYIPIIDLIHRGNDAKLAKGTVIIARTMGVVIKLVP
jgi:hypothetical protein